MLRIYAMYGRTRFMTVLLCCLAVCEATAAGVILGLPRPGAIGASLTTSVPQKAHRSCIDGNNPAPGVYICADGDPPGGHRIAYGWIPVILTESTLLGLSMYKGWENRRLGYGGSVLLRILTRDSVLYFIGCVRPHTSRGW